jgi:hypothetical protein
MRAYSHAMRPRNHQISAASSALRDQQLLKLHPKDHSPFPVLQLHRTADTLRQLTAHYKQSTPRGLAMLMGKDPALPSA